MAAGGPPEAVRSAGRGFGADGPAACAVRELLCVLVVLDEEGDPQLEMTNMPAIRMAPVTAVCAADASVIQHDGSAGQGMKRKNRFLLDAVRRLIMRNNFYRNLMIPEGILASDRLSSGTATDVKAIGGRLGQVMRFEHEY